MATVAQKKARIQAFQTRAAARDVAAGRKIATRTGRELYEKANNVSITPIKAGQEPTGTRYKPSKGTSYQINAAPAVITSKPAKDFLGKVNTDVTNWSNQMQQQVGGTQMSGVTQTFDGKYQIPGDARLYGTEAEAIGALNKQMNGTQNPNQGVIDKLDQTLADTTDQKVLTPEEETVRKANKELEAITAEQDRVDSSFLKQLKQFNSGTFPLSPEENAQIAGLEAAYKRQIEAQKLANANFQGAIVNAGIAAGRSRYAPEIEAGNIQAVVTQGLQKVADLELEAAGKIAELKSNLQDKKYKKILDNYEIVSSIMERRADTIRGTIKSIQDAIKDEQKNRMDQLKFAKDYGTALASTIYSELGDDEAANTQVISQYADLYDIDPNLLLSAVTEYEAERKKEEYGMHSSAYKEWLDYVDNGGKLDFNAYQTMDANRKRSVTNVTLTDRNSSKEAFAKIQAKIQQPGALDTNGYISPTNYIGLRRAFLKDYGGQFTAKDFDEQYGYLANPKNLAPYDIR